MYHLCSATSDPARVPRADVGERPPTTSGSYAVNHGVLPAATPGVASPAGALGDAGGFLGFMQNVLAGISSLIGSLGGGTGAIGNGSDPDGSAMRSFAKFSGSSTGDPHESVDATTAGGGSISKRWDSMATHRHLLDSDSFDGGYDVSTEATPPDAKGVAYNASATVSLGDGTSSVRLNKDGSHSVSRNGNSVSLATGVPLQLGGGTSVLLNGDGSLVVSAANSTGGTLATTLRATGAGVDVSTVGNRVDLGGYLADEAATAPHSTELDDVGVANGTDALAATGG